MKLYTTTEEHQLHWKFMNIRKQVSKKVVFSKQITPINFQSDMAHVTLFSLEVKDPRYHPFSPYTISSNYFITLPRYVRWVNNCFDLFGPPWTGINKIERTIVIKYLVQDFKRYNEKYKYMALTHIKKSYFFG